MTIPSGNVTFLFTDIEGSTMLAQKHAGEYQTALQKHDDILTEVIEFYGGYIFKKAGDSFCAAFTKCEDVLNAVLEIQKRLAEEFKEEIQIKVRMGIHNGAAEYSNGDYMGYVTLSRSHRIMSVAHGGQILLTREAHRDAIHYSEKLNISFRDFGERKLKDIIIPERIFQLVSDRLQTDFPPLKSQDARQNNLPTSLAKFIGRRSEIDEIRKMFATTRLLTLTGAGGTGKTRLAVQSALEMLDEFEHGVWIVELSPVTNPEFVVKEISSVLNVKENAGEDLFKTLKDFLSEKNLLLLIDNSEHLLTKCAPVAEDILMNCAGIKIISTSREAFNISGETVYRVPPLSIPNKIKNEKFEKLKEYEAIKLFLDRAASVNSNFELTAGNITAIAEICKRLDGIPLAIELASKRINVLTVEKILERLSDRFKLLTSGSPTALPRQKTLKAMIDWSYDLLQFNEQLLLQRLSIFMGGWTLEAAEEICSDDILPQNNVLDLMNSLLDKSLINFIEENGQARYVMLETIKEYAIEKLTDKLSDFQKHIEYYLNLTDYYLQCKKGMEQPEWTNLVESELDNVRISIERSILNSLEQAAQLSINMYSFWTNKGYFDEGFDTITKVLETVAIEDKKVKAELLEKAAQFCYMNGKLDKLEELAGEALELSREVNYKDGIINALNAMSLKSYIERNYDYTIKLCEEALVLCKEIQSNSHTATLLLNLSFPVSSLGDKKKALELRKEALELFRIEKNYNSVAETLMGLSIDEVRFRSDFDKAMEYSEESLSILKMTKNNYLTSLNLINLGSLVLLHKKDLSNAEYMLLEAYKLCTDYGYNMNKIPARIFLAVLYMELAQYDKATGFLENNFREREKPGGRFFYRDSVSILMKIKYKMSQYENAAILFGFENFLDEELKMKLALSNLNLNLLENKDLIEKLGEEKFNLYWNKGRKMSLEEGEEFALSMSNGQ